MHTKDIRDLKKSKMKFSNEIPPVYDRLRARFGVDWDSGLIITYGDSVYSKRPVAPDFVVHESVHVRQQRDIGGPDIWYDRYIKDDKFRLSQELEAYRAQIKWIRDNVRDRNESFRMQRNIAMLLSSDMYGNLVTRSEAMRLLQGP
jgi:hypothetical protein